MNISSQLHYLKRYRVMVILLACFAAQNAFASVFISSDPPPQTPSNMRIFLPFGGFSFCLIDGSCQTTDASWVESQLPSLQVGQDISVSTTSSSFGFYLGNSLTGTMEVSLTPVFQTQGITHFVDELTANIANRTAVFSTTHDGHLTFDAVSGSDYYLLLSGLVRGQTNYQLQLSQVPLPAGFYLFSSGLMMLLRFGRKRSSLVNTV